MMKRILITGGSSSVGLQIIQQLLSAKQDYQISVLDLESKQAKKELIPFQEKIQIFWGDICCAQTVKQACSNQDVVIHLAAIALPLAGRKAQLTTATHINGTKNVIQALEEQCNNAFLLYGSSVAVYGNRISNPNIQVGDPLQPSIGDQYAKANIQAEELIQASQLNWSIFRLSATFGVNNHQISSLMFHIPLYTPLEFTTTDDAARAFVHAIEHHEILNNRIFNLGGGESCRLCYKDFINKQFEANGLGHLMFPKYTFAEKNFHCGHYIDGDQLEHILKFRRDSTTSYFQRVNRSVPALQKIITSLIRPFIKWRLISLSEPLQATRTKNKAKLSRYFLPTTVLRILQE